MNETTAEQLPALVPEAPPATTPTGEILPGPDTSNGIIVTCNTKLAATYMVFGYRLRRRDPLYWIDNYQLEDVDRFGLNRAPYVSRCYFNLVPRSAADIQSAKGIGKAFSEQGGQEALFAFVAGLSQLTPAEKHQLLFLSAVVIAEGCRDSLHKRQYLIDQINQMPEAAKWVRVWHGKASATFGRNASLETRTQMLGTI